MTGGDEAATRCWLLPLLLPVMQLLVLLPLPVGGVDVVPFRLWLFLPMMLLLLLLLLLLGECEELIRGPSSSTVVSLAMLTGD